MTEIEQKLSDLSDKTRNEVANALARLAGIRRMSGKEYATARRSLNMVCQIDELVNEAKQIAAGDLRTVKAIESVLCNRATSLYVRLTALNLLFMVDAPGLQEVMASRITDRADINELRFSCAMLLAESNSPLAMSIMLRIINDPSTDEEFRGNALARTALVKGRVPLNLRVLLMTAVLDRVGGFDALEARVKKPMSFRNGWALGLLALWNSSNQSDDYMLMAAEVLKAKSNPISLRINAAVVLYEMRRDPGVHFPNEVWDVIHHVWSESAYGDLEPVIRELLKRQGSTSEGRWANN